MRKRKYKVSITPTGYDPFIRITGKWLKEKGFEVGSKFEIIEGFNMLVLIKISEADYLEKSK